LERCRGAQARTRPQYYDCHCYAALTFIGPKDARTGDPRDIALTATLATMLPMSVFMIACLLFLAAVDKTVIPLLNSELRKSCAATPAFVCVKSANPVPNSITLIPNCLGALLLAVLALLRTMNALLTFCYINLRETCFDTGDSDYNNGVF